MCPMATPADASPFPQDALAANQGGQLTDAQRQNLRSQARAGRKSELSAAFGLLVGGIVLFVAAGPASSALPRLLIGIICVVFAAFLVARAATGGDALTRDLRREHVDTVEGALGKHIVTTYGGRGGSHDFHYFDVDGKSFEVSRTAYHAAPEAGIVPPHLPPN